MKRLIKNGVLVDSQGEYRQDLLIDNGVIRARAADIQPDGETEVIDASGCYVMPGGIDVHTHFNIDVGIARSCDDFFSGTRAAACGGTTSIIDHMGFGPAGCNLHHQLARYHDYAADQAVIDYSFHGVIQHVDDAILHEMAAMVQEEGISSFKLYLTYQYKLGTMTCCARWLASKRWGRSPPSIPRTMPPSRRAVRPCWPLATMSPGITRKAVRWSARRRRSPG